MFAKNNNPLNRPKKLGDVAQEFLILFSLFLLALFGGAIFGIFNRWFVISLVIIFLGLCLLRISYLFSFRKVKISRFLKGALIFLIVLTLFNAYFHHDLPQSRDNIGYLTAGRMLAKHGKLHFKDIISRPYHPYRETNFGEDVFTSQFLPGYNAFLGFWFHWGGLTLALWGNLLLFFLAACCFYGVASEIIKRKWAFLALLFFVTFYAFLWFPRRTNSENLMMFLIWLGLWLFLRGVRHENIRRMVWSLLPASLMILVRGEGLLYLAVFLFWVLVYLIKKRRLLKKNKYFFLPALLVPLNIYLFYLYTRLYQGVYIFEHGMSLFYTIGDFLRVPYMIFILLGGIFGLVILIYASRKVLRKVKWQPKRNGQVILFILLLVLIIVDLVVIYYHHNFKELINWQIYRTQYVLIVLGKYFLLPYFLLFLLALLGPKKLPATIWYTAFLISPNFVFFLDPFVGLDQPWFLRRFYPAVIPFLFILTAWGLAHLGLKKKHVGILIALLLIANLWVAKPIIFFSEHKGIQKELLGLASHFEKESLILMDPGWHWQQWAYALHYLYDYNVLPKLDGFSEEDFGKLLASYQRVYVVSKEKEDIFDSPFVSEDQLSFLFEYDLSYPLISRTAKITPHIMENEDQVQMRRVLVAYRTLLPRQRDVESHKLYIYEYKK